VNENIIDITELTKKYGSFTAVDHLNLAIRKGEIFGLLGPNGAGKSTVILMMLGLTEPDSGSVTIGGINSIYHPVDIKKKVGYLPEDIGFYDDLSGLENLIYIARLNRYTKKRATEKANQMMERVGLAGEKEKKAGKYSRGMRQRLGLAEVLIKDPEVIILDEPTLGIDPTGVRELLDLIVKLCKEDGLTVLFSSHHLHQVQQVCDRVGIFVEGKLLAEGDIRTLSQELLAHSPFIIEVGVSAFSDSHKGDREERNEDPGKSSDIRHAGSDDVAEGAGGQVVVPSLEWLEGVVGHIDGIKAIKGKDNLYSVECSKDLTSEISSAIIHSGAGLKYLNIKEYGLDDIYYRYFEGGVAHE
jgi:ABC-2 type transport system ATP-binding protein